MTPDDTPENQPQSWRLHLRANPWIQCIVSAALLALAFSPLPLSWLLFFALVPWLWGLKGMDGRRAWKHGYFFGLLFSFSQLFWIAVLAARQTDNNWIGLVPWTIAAMLMALYYGLLGVLVQRCLKANRLWLVPLVWAGVEVFRAYIPVFAFPWTLLASPMAAWTPINQSAHVGGMFLFSAWLAFTNVLIASGYDPRNMFSQDRTRNERQIAMRYAVIWAVPLVVSLIFYAIPAQTSSKRMMIVQPGVDMAFGDPAKQDFLVAVKVNEALVEARKQKVDLVVMPEGVGGHIHSMPPILPFDKYDEVPMIFGGKLVKDKLFQTAFAWDGKNWQTQNKTRLVIFGEFVPFRAAIASLAKSYDLPTADISPGEDGVNALKMNDIAVGPILCFEGLFPDITYKQLLNHAEVLTIMSVDDWYMGTTAPEQLRQASCWRAIETGLPVVRAASKGFSMLADSKGRVLYQAPLETPHYEVVDVPLVRNAATWPAFTAAFFAAVSFASGLWVLFFDRPKGKKHRRS